MNCLKTSTKLAVLAFVVSGLSAHGNGAPAAVAAKPAVAAAKVDSKGGAQVAADKKVADGKVAGAAVVKAAVAKPAAAKPAVMPAVAVVPAVMPVAAVVPEVKKEEPKISVKISGQITPEVAFVSALKPENKDDNRQGYQLGVNNVFFNVNPSVKTDAGITFSGVLRLDASRMEGLTTGVANIDPAKSATAENKLKPYPIFTRLYGQAEGSFGKIQFGNLFGSQATSLKGGFDIFYGGYEGLDRTYNPIFNGMFEAPKGGYLTAASGGSTTYFAPSADPLRAHKLIYSTPSFAGFQLTGVFTPRHDEAGSTFNYEQKNMNGVIGNTANRVQNSWFVVPTFKKKFGDVEIDLMGSYGQGTVVDSAGKALASEDASQNPKLWNVSGTIRAKGFEVGGMYTSSGTSMLSKEEIDTKKMDSGSGWNAAVAYNFEKSKVGLMYMATKKAVADSDSVGINCFTAYADYKLADGVKVLISENYLTGTQATTANGAVNAGWANLDAAKARGDTAANVVFLGFDVKF